MSTCKELRGSRHFLTLAIGSVVTNLFQQSSSRLEERGGVGWTWEE
jgi:hypothetical protein